MPTESILEWSGTAIGKVSARTGGVLVLFDLDGTLTDPFAGISAGIIHVCVSLGRPVPSASALRSMIGPPFQDSFPAILGIDAGEVPDAIELYRSVYETGGLFDASVYDGIHATLDALRATGHTLALATSKPTESATRVLEHFGLRGSFDFVGGAARDGSRHQKADVIAHVLAWHDEAAPRPSPRPVMIGDRRYDIEGARAHGLRSIGAGWGYGDDGELTEAGADLIAARPRDLLHHLGG